MTVEDSHLVVAQPDATIDQIVQEIRDSGAQHIQLFVPEEHARLDLFGFIDLMTQLADPGLHITVVSPNAATLDAARMAQFDAVTQRAGGEAPVRSPPPAAWTERRLYCMRESLGRPAELTRLGPKAGIAGTPSWRAVVAVRAEGRASEPRSPRLVAGPAPTGGWGAERARCGASYGDRRAALAPARCLPPHRVRSARLTG